MPDEELKKLIKQNISLMEEIRASLEKQRRIRIWSLVIGIIIIVLPLLAGIIAIPWMMQTVESYYGGILGM